MFKGFNVPILLLIAAILLMNGCDKNSKDIVQDKPLRPVRTMLVEKPDFSKTHVFSAVVDASRKADLSFKVSGEITKFLVNPGDSVVIGQVLAKLDDTDIRIQRNEVKASFDKAKADYVRAKKLIKTNVISRSDFDQLKAQFNSASAKLDSAENSLTYTKLKAPFAGVIAKKYTQNFEEINAKQPIFALHDLTSINLKIDIPESIMVRAKKNKIPINLMAKFDAIPETSFPLKFKEVATQPDDVTKTYEVTLGMESPKDQTILPGMVAHVTAEKILEDDAQANYHLPANVVLKDNDGNFIYTVIAASNGTGTVTRKAVTVGEINQLGIEIFSGVNEGDQVLTAGMSKVSEGMMVKF